MNPELFSRIVKMFERGAEVGEVSLACNVDEDTLWSIYSQVIQRNATKNFYLVKRRTRKNFRRWKDGASILEVAGEENFPPVLMAQFVLEERGCTKKERRAWIQDPSRAPTDRLKKELKQVVQADPVYGPEAQVIQHEMGAHAEECISLWLTERRFNYYRQEELQQLEYPKTPDFLLKEPIEIDGMTIHWIESKGGFGDYPQYRKHLAGQARPYKDLFGNGILVYWWGFVDDIPSEEGLLIKTRHMFLFPPTEEE